jgi:hypothetical protein
LDAPVVALLKVDKYEGGFLFILEPGKEYSASLTKQGTGNIRGGKLQADFLAYQQMVGKANAQLRELKKQMSDAAAQKHYKTASELKAKHEKLQQNTQKKMYAVIQKNKDNVFGLYLLHHLSHSMPSKGVLDRLSSVPVALQNVAFAERLKMSSERRFKTEPQVEGSDYVPHYIDIEQPNLEGEVVSLKSVVESPQNRYVLLNCWASWWDPSIEEAGVLKQAYKRYHNKGFEIYGVSLDRRKESLREGIEELGVVWPTVCSYEEYASSAVEAYAIDPKELPNFLIDCSNGVIIAKNLRGEALLSKLSELLK